MGCKGLERKKEEVEKEVLRLYGVGPATVEYLLFEDFYCLLHLI